VINILILNWNSTQSTRECLRQIILSSVKEFRVILINNFSTISDLSEIREIYHLFKNKVEIFLIENSVNLGYAGGNNEGIRFLETNNYSGNILIVNPDISLSENTISEMERALIDNVGIVTVRTLNPQGKILFDAIKLNGFIQRPIISNKERISTDYSQGSCMLIKREIIEEVGLFDERFFLYWEEVDFSLRVKEIGKKLISITTTHVIRNKNCIAREPLAFYYSVRNARLIRNKNRNIFSRMSYLYYLLRMLLLTFKFIINPNIFIKVVSNYFHGITDSFLNKYNEKK
jgi:GT2 family glycosyltransferase